jgi:lysosomal acid lipase/cholesteryl ester hydrolase
MVENGFPVWLMNSRGTEYSRKHVSFDLDSPEYWNFDLFDMWQDIEANIKTIKAYKGYDTFWYIGYSGATSQMLYAMREEGPYLSRKLRKTILLAPCTFPQYEPPGALKLWESDIDVYEFGGQDWSTQ